MKGKKKTPKVAGFMRAIVAANLAKLLNEHYSSMANITQRQKALALKAGGLSFSTIQRIMKEEVGATLDNIEAIAAAFDLSAYQILLAELDVKNPQVVKGAVKDEERMYRRWKQKQFVRVPEGQPA